MITENSIANVRTFLIELCCVTASPPPRPCQAIEPHSVWTGGVSTLKTFSWRRRWALTQGNALCAVLCVSKAKFNRAKCFLASLAIHISHSSECVCVCPFFVHTYVKQFSPVFLWTQGKVVFLFFFLSLSWLSVSVFLSNQHCQTCLLHMHVYITSLRRHERRSSRAWD